MVNFTIFIRMIAEYQALSMISFVESLNCIATCLFRIAEEELKSMNVTGIENEWKSFHCNSCLNEGHFLVLKAIRLSLKANRNGKETLKF